jgi:hypothetical protein
MLSLQGVKKAQGTLKNAMDTNELNSDKTIPPKCIP